MCSFGGVIIPWVVLVRHSAICTLETLETSISALLSFNLSALRSIYIFIARSILDDLRPLEPFLQRGPKPDI